MSETPVRAKEKTIPGPNQVDAGIHRLFQELNREDSRLREFLLDVALAGLRLERNPESQELRLDAAQVWATIEPMLAAHLDAEDRRLLPWLDKQKRLTPGTQSRILESHQKLRKLVGAVTAHSMGGGTAHEAREIGIALAGLAVALDDMIEDEQRRLLPALQRALFGTPRQ